MRRDALRDHAFRRLLGAQAISVLGDAFATIAIAFAVLALTGSASDLGIVLAARMVPLVAFMLAGGVWGDRLPRRNLLIASNAVRCVTQGVLAALVLLSEARLWEIVVLTGAHGLASAFFHPAMTGYIPEIVPRRRLQHANALLSVSFSTAGIAGPALAGIVVAVFGPGWALAVDAVSFLVSAVLLAGLPASAASAAPAGSPFLRDVAAGWHEIRARSWLWASIAVSGLLQLTVLGPVLVLGPLVAEQSLGGASAWGAILAAAGAGGVLGGVLAMRVRPRRLALASAACLLGLVPSLLLLALGAPVWSIALCRMLDGAAIGLSITFWETALQSHVPREALSRVAAYDWMGSTALRPLGLALAGPVAAVIGVRATLMASAAILVVSTVALLSLRDVRRLVTEDDVAPVPAVQIAA